MNGIESGVLWALIGALTFGCAFAVVVYVPLRGKHGGYTSLLVVVGTAATLGISACIIGIVPVLWVAACFALTGAPMVAGEAITAKLEELRERKKLLARLESLVCDETTADAKSI